MELYSKSIPEGKSPAGKLEQPNIAHLFLNEEFFRKDMGEKKVSTYCGSAKY
jgi:hypothetical protein